MARPPDPLRGFRFLVEIEGIASGGFSRIKGLTREVKIESRREGGVNDYEHKLVTGVSYASVVFERGLVLDDLWQWALDAADGNVKRKNVWVRLHDEADAVVSKWAWQIESAFPVKWSTSDLDGASSQVLVESLELAHHGLRKST